MVLTEAGRVALSILVVATVTVGGTWAYTATNGPLSDTPQSAEEREGVFLVTYRLHTWEHETDSQPFPMNGHVAFSNMPIPLQNVTTVEVTLQASMRGPAVNDEYTVRLIDPREDERRDTKAVPSPSMEGYVRSDTIITWSRTPQPSSETYTTPDRHQAATWSAENHTDTSANGNWTGTVSLNQPVLARQGNVSLLLRFNWYEAVVLPQTAPPPADPVGIQPANTTEPENTSFEVAPRTFIMSRSVGGTR